MARCLQCLLISSQWVEQLTGSLSKAAVICLHLHAVTFS